MLDVDEFDELEGASWDLKRLDVELAGLNGEG